MVEFCKTLIKKKKYYILLCLLFAFILTSCNANINNPKKENSNSNSFSYNVIEKNNITEEELVTSDINEILNISRGYISAWNKTGIDFMDKVFNDTINGMNKKDFIQEYRHDYSRYEQKKCIDSISMVDYSKNNAKVKIVYAKKNKYSFDNKNEEKQETVIITFTHKGNNWLIYNISYI